jgi:Putative zinc-finger
MRCDDCQLIIEEYFDGELNQRTGLRVSRHLEGCPSCSDVLQKLTAEQVVYVGGRQEIQIRSDLWSGVRARLALEEHRPSAVERLQTWLGSALVLPRISGLATVALVILASGLTMLLMRYLDRPFVDRPLESVSENAPQSAPTPQSAAAQQEDQSMLEQEAAAGPRNSLEGKQNTGASAPVESIAAERKSKLSPRRLETIVKAKTAEQLVREAELKYLTAIAMLSRTVDRKRAHIDVATLAKLEQALASIDRTIADTRKAVRRHPDDPVVVQYMLTAYAKKVNVLREIVDY